MLLPVAVPKPVPRPPTFELDDRQRQAVEHVHGPMLVVAGAGTGKTTVLIRRIAHLIREAGVHPGEILALTYTDNAAREMGQRVQAELRTTDLKNLQTKTFHAYCNELLARHGRQFGVLDDADLWIYLRRRIRELNLNYFVRAANVSQFLHDLLDFMRRCQDELVGPDKYADYVHRVGCGETPIPRVTKSKHADELSPEEAHGRCQEIATVFATVERMLRADNLGTFGHMITHAYELLQSHPNVLAKEREHARFILVDEFQDSNFAQVKILQRLAGEERNVFAVGDPDQAIYRFRGASSAAFGLFQRHFQGARLVALEKNRRSTTPILQAAYAVISKNPEVFSPAKAAVPYRRSPLVSAREEDARKAGRELPSVPVELAFTDKEVECADVVAAILEKKRQLRCSWKDFAVLYRLHSHRDEIVEELAEHGIPFSIENMDVADTPDVRDLLACAGAVVSLNDSVSLLRVAALPQFQVNPEALRAGIRALPRDAANAGVASVLEKIAGGQAVLDALQRAKAEIDRSGAKAGAALDIIIRCFALDRASRPMQAVLGFVQKWEEKPITDAGVLGELLEYLDDFRQAGGSISMPTAGENAITLITAHGAKGLEFTHVFVLRIRSGSFPWSFKEPLFEFPQALRDPDSVGQGDDKALHDEEERRLFYVAMTRARDSLTLYGKQSTGKDPTPPVYLRELAKDRSLGRALRQRHARGLQTEIFAAAADSGPGSRTMVWLAMPPASDMAATLSASAVASYQKCPLQFKLEREWRLPTEPPAPLQYGATMHRVLRAYFDSFRFGRPMEEATLLQLFRDDLAGAGLQDPYQFELYEKQGIAQLRDLVAQQQRGAAPTVLHTEEAFEIRVGKTAVIGRIDRIDDTGDGRVAITDYKTGRPQSQEDADESLQLSIYALAAKEKWGYHPDQLVFYNLQENAPVVSHRLPVQLEEAKAKIQDVAARITAGEFKPKTGLHCSFCAYRKLCPATEKRLYSTPNPDKAGGAKN
jgi:DNA helicase-2/ATP-dependent DNA helicase PcrA